MNPEDVRAAAESARLPSEAHSAGFLQLQLRTDVTGPRERQALEELEADLFAAGALSVTLEDAADEPILEPPPGATPLWSAIVIKALFDARSDRTALESRVRHRLGRAPELSFEAIADRVWEREWLKDFKPMQFGRRLWVCPGGQRPPVGTTAAEGAQTEAMIEIKLDPGLAFGTGTHPTTALCLEWLDGQSLRGKTFIDYGCGSGILAIAALKLGARLAVGIDIDPQALLASRANAERNGVAERLTLRKVDGDSDGNDAKIVRADVVIANILAGPLEELAERLASQVAPGGDLVLSGLLESQAAAVAARYAPWFDMTSPRVREQWVRLAGVRNNVQLPESANENAASHVPHT